MTKEREYKDPLLDPMVDPDIPEGMDRCSCCHTVRLLEAFAIRPMKFKKTRYKVCIGCRQKNSARKSVSTPRSHIKPMASADYLADASPTYKKWVTRAWV